MCHDRCRHDPKGPRTKTNPPSQGVIIQADKARNDFQTVGRQLFQTSKENSGWAERRFCIILQDSVPNQRLQNAECLQFSSLVAGLIRCVANSSRLAVVRMTQVPVAWIWHKARRRSKVEWNVRTVVHRRCERRNRMAWRRLIRRECWIGQSLGVGFELSTRCATIKL